MDKYLKCVRLYKIYLESQVKKINSFLEDAKKDYFNKHGEVQKRDVICIPEYIIKDVYNDKT